MPSLRTTLPAPEVTFLSIVAVLVPLLGALAPLQVWIPIAVAAALIAAYRVVVARAWPISSSAFAAILLVVAVWCGASSFWAVNPANSLRTLGQVSLVAMSLLVLMDAGSRMGAGERVAFARWLTLGMIVMLAITLATAGTIIAHTLWVEQIPMHEGKLAGLNRTASLLGILTWPTAIAIARAYGQRAAIWFVGAAIITIFILAPLSPLLAAIAGAVVFTIGLRTPAVGRAALFVVSVGFVLAIPFTDIITDQAKQFLVANLSAPQSEVHRFIIWEFATDKIFERPLFGWGLDASRDIPGGQTMIYLFDLNDGRTAFGQALPLHPHNAVIQIWLELGIIGLALLALLFAAAIKATAQAMNRFAQAAAAATVTSAFVMAQLGFGVWQGWWIASLATITIFTTIVAWPGHD